MSVFLKSTGNGFSYWYLLFLKNPKAIAFSNPKRLYSKNMEALLYTHGKCYGTLRHIQRSEAANCGHFVLSCTFWYPVFTTRCRSRVCCSLPQLCPQLEQVFVSSTFRSLSQQRGFSLVSGVLPGVPCGLKLPQECRDGMGGDDCAPSPPTPIPSPFVPPAGAGVTWASLTKKSH